MSIFRPHFNGPDLTKARNYANAIIKKYGIRTSEELDLEAIAWAEFRTLVVTKLLDGCDARAIHSKNGGIITLSALVNHLTDKISRTADGVRCLINAG